jgi:hypothetical protein
MGDSISGIEFMQSCRPPPPIAVRKPLPLVAAAILFLTLSGFRAIPTPPSMVRAWLIEPMFPFAVAGAIALVFFPARRLTYAITCFCLAAVVIDVLALTFISVVDASSADFEFNWVFPVSGWVAMSLLICSIFFFFSLGRRTRRYYGFLDPTIRVEIHRDKPRR